MKNTKPLDYVRGTKLSSMIRKDIKYIHERFPKAKLIWSDIISRLQWRNARSLIDIKKVESKRKCVNRVGRQAVCQLEGHCIAHDINYTKPELYLRDGVHLSVKGNDILINTFTEALSIFSKPDSQKYFK